MTDEQLAQVTRRPMLMLVFGNLALALGVAAWESEKHREQVVAADRIDNLKIAVAYNSGRQEGRREYAAQNKTEIQVILKAQETLLRLRHEKDGDRDNPDGLRPARTRQTDLVAERRNP